MKFEVIENFEGEKAHPCICAVKFKEAPTSSEVAALSTVDARLLWKFIRGIRRRHPKKFEKKSFKSEDLLTIALIRAPSYPDDLAKCSTYVSFDGEYFGLAPRWQDDDPALAFAVPEPPVAEDTKYRTMTDYHAYLTDKAEEYWAHAEDLKIESSKESQKMCMEFRAMHHHYTVLADEVLHYIENIL